jgi:hypothetical protein
VTWYEEITTVREAHKLAGSLPGVEVLTPTPSLSEEELPLIAAAPTRGVPTMAAPQPSGAARDKTAGAPTETAKPRKAKRSTEQTDAEAKLIAALTKHHQYADGGCLNLDAIGCRALAQQAKVGLASASRFFDKHFKGHKKYRNHVCADKAKLITALKMLNQEFSPCDLYGAKPPGEGERDD